MEGNKNIEEGQEAEGIGQNAETDEQTTEKNTETLSENLKAGDTTENIAAHIPAAFKPSTCKYGSTPSWSHTRKKEMEGISGSSNNDLSGG